jgi:putative hydrolase of the HAD superfamily
MMSMIRCVLFDMGNTLVAYYIRRETQQVLKECLDCVVEDMDRRGLGYVGDDLKERFDSQAREESDHRVKPLWRRISVAWDLDDHASVEALQLEVQKAFLEPIFARGRIYPDTLPTLRRLKEAGYITGIVSNTPWGSPGDLWREELDRMGLISATDFQAFCTDAGWRKPAPQIFEHVLDLAGVPPEACLFVGDDPRWDTLGAHNAGMRALLIDREGELTEDDGPRIEALGEVFDHLS